MPYTVKKKRDKGKLQRLLDSITFLDVEAETENNVVNVT